MLDQFAVRHIAEGNIRNLYGSVNLFFRQYSRICFVRSAFFFIEQFKNAARTCHGILKLCDNAGNFIKRFRVLVCIT